LGDGLQDVLAGLDELAPPLVGRGVTSGLDLGENGSGLLARVVEGEAAVDGVAAAPAPAAGLPHVAAVALIGRHQTKARQRLIPRDLARALGGEALYETGGQLGAHGYLLVLRKPAGAFSRGEGAPR